MVHLRSHGFENAPRHDRGVVTRLVWFALVFNALQFDWITDHVTGTCPNRGCQAWTVCSCQYVIWAVTIALNRALEYF